MTEILSWTHPAHDAGVELMLTWDGVSFILKPSSINKKVKRLINYQHRTPFWHEKTAVIVILWLAGSFQFQMCNCVLKFCIVRSVCLWIHQELFVFLLPDLLVLGRLCIPFPLSWLKGNHEMFLVQYLDGNDINSLTIFIDVHKFVLVFCLNLWWATPYHHNKR